MRGPVFSALLAAAGLFVALVPGRAETEDLEGKALSRKNCGACHTSEKNGSNRQGPISTAWSAAPPAPRRASAIPRPSWPARTASSGIAGCSTAGSPPRAIETPPYPSTHDLGTNRMSEKMRDGVVNSHGQTHDIPNLFVSDGSQFTTGGAENPTLAIVALAIRQADYIAEQMGKNAI